MEQPDTFLRFVAETALLTHKIEDFHRLTFVFPSSRAGAFFLRELSQLTGGKPFFAPHVESVDHLISRLSNYRSIDSLSLLFELYLAYSELLGDAAAPSFSDFAYWGKMMLKDFDDIDLYLLDARQVFSNIADLKEIGADQSFLSEDQIAAIRSFWKDFEPCLHGQEKVGRTEFLSFYRSLAATYMGLRGKLQSSGNAYRGMIYRNVSEKENFIDLLSSSEHYYICGLFYLTPAEVKIFSRMQKSGKLTFLWDWTGEVAWDERQEAYKILQRNRERLGGTVFYGHKDRRPQLSVLGVPSFNAQAKALPQLLEIAGMEPISSPTQLIVPADDRLLIPLLSAVPSRFDRINVTMGYPLAQTSAASCLLLWCDLQLYLHEQGTARPDRILWPYQKVLNLLSNPLLGNDPTIRHSSLMRRMEKEQLYHLHLDLDTEDSVLIRLLLRPTASTGEFLSRAIQLLDQLVAITLPGEQEDGVTDGSEELLCGIEAEYLLRLKEILLNLHNLSTRVKHRIDLPTAIDLLRTEIRTATFPFQGEPLVGLQVMGQLETRCLAFSKQIFLAAADTNLPGSSIVPTLIPYNIRRGYGLPHGNVEQATAAYHFYRLIATAQEVLLVYDSRSGGSSVVSEETRYIKQLSYVYGYRIQQIDLNITGDLPPNKPISVVKDERIQTLLATYLTSLDESIEPSAPALSPSRITQYLNCPLRFYFEAIESIHLYDEPNETIEANDFGNILHLAMENIYAHLMAQRLPSTSEVLHPIELQQIEELLQKNPSGKTVEAFVQEAHAEYYRTQVDRLGGMAIVTVDLISYYVTCILKQDAELIRRSDGQHFFYIASERKLRGRIPITLSGNWLHSQPKHPAVRIKGTIDRLDLLDGSVRVVDYKTGRTTLTAKANDSYYLTDNKGKPFQKEIDQTLLYSELLLQNTSAESPLRAYPVRPVLYAVQSISMEEKDEAAYGALRIPRISMDELAEGKKADGEDEITDYRSQVATHYRKALQQCLQEIFDVDKPFTQAPEEAVTCRSCPFSSICGR